MTEHPNAQIIRRLYAAFEATDFSTIESLLREDVTWNAAGRNWLVGEYRGRTAVLDLLAAIAEYGEGHYTTELYDVLASDRHAIGLHRSRAYRSDGLQMSVDDVLVFSIDNGRISKVWATPWDQYEEDQFYGLEPPEGRDTPDSRTSALATSWTSGPGA
ncbi:MAG: nuclear transport factor 2 family protein [Ferrimicrobium sp.]